MKEEKMLFPPVPELTEEETKMLQHCLGVACAPEDLPLELDFNKQSPIRNFYSTEGKDPVGEGLVERGLMVGGKYPFNQSGGWIYRATKAGMDATRRSLVVLPIWEVREIGQVGVRHVRAKTAGKARYRVALRKQDVENGTPVGEILKRLRVRKSRLYRDHA